MARAKNCEGVAVPLEVSIRISNELEFALTENTHRCERVETCLWLVFDLNKIENFDKSGGICGIKWNRFVNSFQCPIVWVNFITR